jgi:hypothetical protein
MLQATGVWVCLHAAAYGEADAPFLPIRGLPRLSRADIAGRLK